MKTVIRRSNACRHGSKPSRRSAIDFFVSCWRPRQASVHIVPVRRAGFGAITLVVFDCACTPVVVDEPRLPIASVRSTQFAAPPPPVTDAVPSAEQLTALLAASLNYSVREEDRARLFDGPTERNVSLARAWGAQPNPQHIDFTTVEVTGPDTVDASGRGSFRGLEPYSVGPIPFVRFDNAWKVSRTYACGIVRALDGPDTCS